MTHEPRIEIFASRRQRIALIRMGAIVLLGGVLLSLIAVSQGTGFGTNKLWGYAGLSFVVGLSCVIPNAWALQRPTPLVVVDAHGIRDGRICLHRSNIAFEEVAAVIVFRVRDWRYLGIAPIQTPRHRPFKWTTRLNKWSCGQPVAFTFSESLLGDRFEETATLIAEIVGCELVRKG